MLKYALPSAIDMLSATHIDTPLGKMYALTTDKGLCVFDFEQRRMLDAIVKRVKKETGYEIVNGAHKHFDVLRQQIGEYFAGGRTEFDLPLHMAGTDFQIRVWKELMCIPYGCTRSYLKQSVALGNEKAIRAVARANGENGLAIIVPCHRVIGTNGSLVGYGGGLWRKKWLLDHEMKIAGQTQQLSLY